MTTYRFGESPGDALRIGDGRDERVCAITARSPRKVLVRSLWRYGPPFTTSWEWLGTWRQWSAAASGKFHVEPAHGHAGLIAVCGWPEVTP